MSLSPEKDELQRRKEMPMMLSDAERFAVFVCQDPHGELLGFASPHKVLAAVRERGYDACPVDL
jgi:hypothetical protein